VTTKCDVQTQNAQKYIFCTWQTGVSNRTLQIFYQDLWKIVLEYCFTAKGVKLNPTFEKSGCRSE